MFMSLSDNGEKGNALGHENATRRSSSFNLKTDVGSAKEEDRPETRKLDGSTLNRPEQATTAYEQGTQETLVGEDDSNIVDWDGPEDPAKPTNWTKRKKIANSAIISFITFLTPLASSMVAPAVPLVLREFGSTSSTIGSFIVSVYVLGFAVGPLCLAPLSEVYGRVPVYWACNCMFVVWTIACALAPNIPALLVFRLLGGIAGSSPLTIGGGTIADMFVQEERGSSMAFIALGPILGPVIGPVAGGYLGQAKGWRWIFWAISIAGGVGTIFSVLIQKETYWQVILERKANRLRKETGNPDLRSKMAPTITKEEFFVRAIVRPTKMLLFSPIVAALSVYMAIIYGYLYLLFTTFTIVYEERYHFSQGNIGLTFLGIGIGSLLGMVIFGAISDLIVKRMAKAGEMKPEYRLPPLIPGSLLIPIGLFWYGWAAQAKTHWIVPILGTLWVGLGLIAIFMPVQTYLVDCFDIHAASAIAANTVLRSIAGAFLPLAGPKLYEDLGLGWGNSLLAFLALAMTPLSWIFFRYGEKIRKSPRFNVKF